MFSLSSLGFIIGGILLIIPYLRRDRPEPTWQEAVATVSTEYALTHPDYGLRVNDTECSRKQCKYHDGYVCKKPYNEYCSFE